MDTKASHTIGSLDLIRNVGKAVQLGSLKFLSLFMNQSKLLPVTSASRSHGGVGGDSVHSAISEEVHNWLYL